MKIQKKSGVSGPAGDGGSRGEVGRGGWLVAMLGVGGDVGYGGCESRIEGIVQYVKKGIVQY